MAVYMGEVWLTTHITGLCLDSLLAQGHEIEMNIRPVTKL